MQSLILKIVGLVSAAVAASSLLAIVGGVLNSPPAWFLLCFELVVLLAGVLGVLTGMGRFSASVPWAVLCVAGAVAVASVLGYLGADRQLMGYSLRFFLMVRLAAAAVLGAAAAADVLRHDPRSVGALIKGIGLGAIPLAVAVGLWNGAGSALAGLGGTAQALIYGLGFIVVAGLLCASLHLTIRAFQMGARAAGSGRIICPKCGYPLAGLPLGDGAVTCSECGTRTPTAALAASS